MVTLNQSAELKQHIKKSHFLNKKSLEKQLGKEDPSTFFLSFNLWAFLLGPIWYFYRSMFIEVIVLTLVTLGINIGVFYLLTPGLLLSSTMKLGINVGSMLLCMSLWSGLANWLYIKKLARWVKSKKQPEHYSSGAQCFYYIPYLVIVLALVTPVITMINPHWEGYTKQQITQAFEQDSQEQIAILEALLDKGFHIEQKNEIGETTAHTAARLGHIQALKFLTKRGASLNTSNNKGVSLLNTAIYEGHLEVVAFLCDQDLDLNTIDASGNYPMVSASVTGDVEMLELLAQNQASTDYPNKDGITGLAMAAYHGHTNAVSWFLEQGMSYETRDKMGNTPLFYSVQGNHLEVAELLLNLGSDPQHKNELGVDALQIAEHHGSQTMISLLNQFKT